MLYTFEPMIVKKYPKAFLQQFDVVVTNCTNIKGKHVVYTQTSLPWMVGCIFDPKTREWLPTYSKNYDELKTMRISDKRDKISMIISNKNFTSGHKKRLQFAEALREHFKEKIDLFGVGITPIRDKWDALYPYKYAVVLENTTQENYWSEKLSDAFLSFCFPFYVGCPNILEYFPHKSLISLSINDVDSSIRAIEHAMNDDIFTSNFEYIVQSRAMILDKYQLFPSIVTQIKNRKWPETPYTKCIIQSQRTTRTLSERIVNKLKWNRFNKYLPNW